MDGPTSKFSKAGISFAHGLIRSPNVKSLMNVRERDRSIFAIVFWYGANLEKIRGHDYRNALKELVATAQQCPALIDRRNIVLVSPPPIKVPPVHKKAKKIEVNRTEPIKRFGISTFRALLESEGTVSFVDSNNVMKEFLKKYKQTSEEDQEDIYKRLFGEKYDRLASGAHNVSVSITIGVFDDLE